MVNEDALDELLDPEEKQLLVTLYDAWAQQSEAFVFPSWDLDAPTLSQDPPSTVRLTPPMTRLRALAEADLIALALPPPRTRKRSAPGGSVNPTIGGRHYYRRLKDRDRRDDRTEDVETSRESSQTQAQAFGRRQDVTLPDPKLREQLKASRQQWDFVNQQASASSVSPQTSPGDAATESPTRPASPEQFRPLSHGADSAPPAPTEGMAQPENDTQSVDFVSWCGSVLRALLTLQESPPNSASIGVRLDELARAIFGTAEDTTVLYSSTRGQALADAHRDLKSLGLIEDVSGNRFRIPRHRYDEARDQADLWRSICARALDPEEERVLRLLNRQSERRADDHAFLEPVVYTDLYPESGTADEHETQGRIINIVRNLQDVGMARRGPGMGGLSARATYSGLVWENRRWVLDATNTKTAKAKEGVSVDSPAQPEAGVSRDPKRVFVVYGRNAAAHGAIKLFLRSIGLEPWDFDQVRNEIGGSPFVGEIVRYGMERAQAVLVLFTPDEWASLHPSLVREQDTQAERNRWQPRPNVLIEAGMAMAIDERRTILVSPSDIDIASDLLGRHFIRLGNDHKSRSKLRDALAGARCAVNTHIGDMYEISLAGDFEACFAPPVLSEVSTTSPFS